MNLLLVLLLFSAQATAGTSDQTDVRLVAGTPEAKAFIAAYGQPSNAVLAEHHWHEAAAQDLSQGVLHALPNARIGAEAPYFSLFVRAYDGKIFLMRQSGFSGTSEFFGPVPLDGT